MPRLRNLPPFGEPERHDLTAWIPSFNQSSQVRARLSNKKLRSPSDRPRMEPASHSLPRRQPPRGTAPAQIFHRGGLGTFSLGNRRPRRSTPPLPVPID